MYGSLCWFDVGTVSPVAQLCFCMLARIIKRNAKHLTKNLMRNCFTTNSNVLLTKVVAPCSPFNDFKSECCPYF